MLSPLQSPLVTSIPKITICNLEISQQRYCSVCSMKFIASNYPSLSGNACKACWTKRRIPPSKFENLPSFERRRWGNHSTSNGITSHKKIRGKKNFQLMLLNHVDSNFASNCNFPNTLLLHQWLEHSGQSMPPRSGQLFPPQIPLAICTG